LTFDNAAAARLSAAFTAPKHPSEGGQPINENPHKEPIMNTTISPHRARIAQLAASGRPAINPETNRAFTSEELDRLSDQTLKILAAQLSMQPAGPVMSVRLSSLPVIPINPYTGKRYCDADLEKYPSGVVSFLLRNMPTRVASLSADGKSSAEVSASSYNKIVAANKRDNLRTLISKLQQQGAVPVNPETDQPYSIDDLDAEGGKYPVEVLYHLVTNMPVARNSEAAKLSAGSVSSDNGLRGVDRMAAANQRDNDDRGYSTNGRVGGYAMGFRPS
jgi:hypothetical protein